MRARRLRAAAVAAALLGPLPVAGVGQAGATPPALTRTTVVAASGTGWTPVRLDRPVAISPFARPAVTVSGRVTALMLVADLPGEHPPGLVIPHLPAPEVDLRYLLVGRDPVSGGATAVTGQLPPGPYRLYVVGEGAATVRFELPGLPSREQRLRASRATRATHLVREAPRTGGHAPPVYADGANGELERDGLLFWARFEVADRRVASRSGNCFYRGGAPDTYFGVPGCPFGSSAGFLVVGDEWREVVAYSFGRYPAGRYGLGEFNVAASVVQRVGLVAVWLDR